ncbi:MAG: hypothetical protein PHE33_06590 [Bacteroidales bacterium]|nr:hypothetical protein [Bacteroidales bacterium]
MKSKKIIRIIMVWLTLVSLSLLIINNGVFLHTHKLDDGRIISHAHPFKTADKTSSGEAQHHHSLNEILIYQILDSITMLLIVFAIIEALIPVTQRLVRFYFYRPYKKDVINGYSIRPPPFSLA